MHLHRTFHQGMNAMTWQIPSGYERYDLANSHTPKPDDTPAVHGHSLQLNDAQPLDRELCKPEGQASSHLISSVAPVASLEMAQRRLRSCTMAALSFWMVTEYVNT